MYMWSVNVRQNRTPRKLQHSDEEQVKLSDSDFSALVKHRHFSPLRTPRIDLHNYLQPFPSAKV